MIRRVDEEKSGSSGATGRVRGEIRYVFRFGPFKWDVSAWIRERKLRGGIGVPWNILGIPSVIPVFGDWIIGVEVEGDTTYDQSFNARRLSKTRGTLLYALPVALIPIIGLILYSSHSSTPPPTLHDEGACPGEGCHYGNWTARATVQVYDAPGARLPSFTIGEGASVTAEQGFVSARPGKVEVRERREDGCADRTWETGEVLYPYTYLGEGAWKVWYAGEYLTSCAWDTADFTNSPESVWWAKIHDSRGRSGWVIVTHNFSGVSVFD